MDLLYSFVFMNRSVCLNDYLGLVFFFFRMMMSNGAHADSMNSARGL